MMESTSQNTEAPLNQRVAVERKRRGLSQQNVADAVGMSLRAYADFENGKSKPQPRNMRAILRTFDLEPATYRSDTEGEQRADETRGEWTADIHVFLDMMGAFLATMDEAERLRFMHEETRRIIGRRP